MTDTAIITATQTLPAAVTPMDMIDKALASGASPEALEKLLALQERWEANQAKRAFDTAMAEAKAELPRVIKNKRAGFESKKTGETTSYAYETLDALSAAIDPVLHRHGLSYRYSSKVEGGQISVTCVVSHSQGHKEETTLQCAPDTSGAKNSVQAIGSATTYLQRYTLKLALGVSASTDDDAKAAEATEMDMTINADQFQELRDLVEQTKSKEADMLTYVGAKAMEEMTLRQYAKAKSVLVKKVATMKKDAA